MIGDILQPTHLLFVLIVALLVLGPKRLPEAGRALGTVIRDFRTAMSGDEPDRSAMMAPMAPTSVETPPAPVATAAPAPTTETMPAWATDVIAQRPTDATAPSATDPTAPSTTEATAPAPATDPAATATAQAPAAAAPVASEPQAAEPAAPAPAPTSQPAEPAHPVA